MSDEVTERGAMGFDEGEIDEEASTRALKKAAEALGIKPGIRGPERIDRGKEESKKSPEPPPF